MVGDRLSNDCNHYQQCNRLREVDLLVVRLEEVDRKVARLEAVDQKVVVRKTLEPTNMLLEKWHCSRS